MERRTSIAPRSRMAVAAPLLPSSLALLRVSSGQGLPVRTTTSTHFKRKLDLFHWHCKNAILFRELIEFAAPLDSFPMSFGTWHLLQEAGKQVALLQDLREGCKRF